MTWRVLEQQADHVRVGADDRTDATRGDASIDQVWPILCLLKDDRAMPGSIKLAPGTGWVQGALQLTRPIAGHALLGREQADGICARAFGRGWRMARFGDGAGAGAYWGEGELPAGTRFWVAIDDQPANPWDGAAAGTQAAPRTSNYQQHTVRSGAGWKLTRSTGKLSGTGAVFNEQFYTIDGEDGLLAAPIPQQLKEAIAADIAAAPASEPATYSISKSVADEIALSAMQGRPTQRLIALAAEGGAVAGMARGGILGCNNKEIVQSKAFDLSSPIHGTYHLGGGTGFTGNVSLSGNAKVNALGEVSVTLKRSGIWHLCVPYGVKLHHARVKGAVRIEQGATVSGSITYANPTAWEWQIAKPFLFSIDFMAGPIPVHIGFNMPITAGFDENGITATIAGEVTYSGQRSISGDFDYRCSGTECSGSSRLDSKDLGAQPVTASISGRFQPSLYAQVAFRGYLYSDSVAYAQAGIRAYLMGDLWGYYGNHCDDADGDGRSETVNALTFDLDWQLKVVGQADTFLTSEWRKDLWTSPRRHVQFWDLLGGAGSRALTPVLEGPGLVPANKARAYRVAMRSCWPYRDPVDYELAWGDGGAAQSLTGLATTGQDAVHSWTQLGSPALRLTALRDAHGRKLGKSTTRTVEVAESTSRHGVTWKLHATHGAYSLVGPDAQTRPYQGDTDPTVALPVLCLKQVGAAVPMEIVPHLVGAIGWGQGEIGLTQPIAGRALTSRAVADQVCAASFGSGFRMAEYVHGRHGYSYSWWAQGVIRGDSRFWVAVDQPANPWN
ncbi:hypothetical protein [Dyella sp. 2RAB6]|uniref:hypothetical protein n=1 Tax=Dyella sp. 2RAB6 TaxID=3232992 RepID=UPI003F8FA3D7